MQEVEQEGLRRPEGQWNDGWLEQLEPLLELGPLLGPALLLLFGLELLLLLPPISLWCEIVWPDLRRK